MNLVFSDLAEGLVRWRLWTMLAVQALKGLYRRTLLGPIWVTVSFGMFIGVKIFIFGAMNMSSSDAYFIGHLTMGFMVWNYITNAIVGGVGAFVHSRNWILGINTPYSIFIYQLIALATINFTLSAIAALIITDIYLPITLTQYFYALLGFLYLVFALFWVQLLLAVIGAFFRDVVQVIGTIMRVMFFMTPILWLPDALGARAAFVNWNPFTHYLALVRAPLLVGAVPADSLMIVTVITLVTMVASIVAFSIGRKIIPAHI